MYKFKTRKELKKMVEKIKTETNEEKESAAKYLQEELNFRLKNLNGKPDALCQAYPFSSS